MPTVFILHGAYGSPDENWIPWLRQQLEASGHTVITPIFPTPENQNLDSWMAIFQQYTDHVDSESIFIGHSIAVAFILRALEKIDISIKGSILVSGFVSSLHNPDFDSINKSFYRDPFHWDAIVNHSKKFRVIHSDNDPYVSVDHAQNLAASLGIEPLIIPNGGHFNADSGYETFQELLEVIQAIF